MRCDAFDPRAERRLLGARGQDELAVLVAEEFVVAAFALLSICFLLTRFSFGYFVGFYLYLMVFGYLWLNFFSDRDYLDIVAPDERVFADMDQTRLLLCREEQII